MSGPHRLQEQALYEYTETGHSNDTADAGIPYPHLLSRETPRVHSQHLDASRLPASTSYSTSFNPYLPHDVQGQGHPSLLPTLYPLPTVTSYSSATGPQGYRMRMQLKSRHAISVPPTLYIFIVIGKLRRQASLNREYIDPQFHYYSLESDIPPPESALEASMSQYPLSLQFQDHYGNTLGTVEVGSFSYLDTSDHESGSYATLATRKRKQSIELSDPLRSPPKRSTAQQLISRSSEPSSSYKHQNSPHVSSYSILESAAPYTFQHQIPYHFGHGSASMGSQPLRQPAGHYAFAQRLPTSPLTLPTHESARRSSSLSGAAGPLTMTIGRPSSLSTSAPTLVRTSGMSSSTGPISNDGASTPAFNPYAIYPKSKAELKLDGSLDDLATDWTHSEWEAKRRLVQFQRSQSGSVITASFKAVSIEDRSPGSICISCILWEAKNECFVTSVDTIYLLESLVAVKFTVEEKNRIRRNLEGFRPLTVSKAKTDSEDFFKVIMGFPNPKPRNIEKDVKVFPWKILSHALKKIIGKYSASYASTAGALPIASTTGDTRRVQQQSHDTLDPKAERRALESPISASSSGTSAYPEGSLLTSTVRSQSWATKPLRTDPVDVGTPIAYDGTTSRHLHYLGLDSPPGMTSALSAQWPPHRPPQHFSGHDQIPRELDPSAAESARGLPQYYPFPQTTSNPGHDQSSQPRDESFDLQEGHAYLTSGATQNLKRI